METSTLLYVVAAILIAYGYMKYSEKKTDVGKFAMAIGAVLAIVVFSGGAGTFASLTAAPSEGVPQFVPGVLDGSCQVKPYENVTFSGDTWGANDPTAPEGSISFYSAGVDPSEPGANTLTNVSVTSGVGHTLSGVLESCTNYGIIYNGASAEYDMWYNGHDWTQANQLPYISTTESAISKAVLKFNDVIVVASIPDPFNEASVTGILNGQTNVTAEEGSTNELGVGTDNAAVNGETIYYNKSAAASDSSFYIDITLGATGANSKLKDPALCFVNLANPMDGNEFTAVTLTRQSGVDFGLPTDITAYVSGADCVPMGAWIEGGQTAVYRLQFTAVNASLDVGTDIMYIYTDDCGEYLGKDILRNTKATAGSVVTLEFEI